MNNLISNIEFSALNQKLIATFNEDHYSNGLASGKMGFCIYFYVLSRLENDSHYTFFAEKLLDDIFTHMDKTNSLDIHKGISGIGLGINYLIKEKFVQGDINDILRNIDDFVFVKLSYTQNCISLSTLEIIHLLIYLNIRLQDQKQASEQEYLYKELIIQTINALYEQIELPFFEEPSAFTIDFKLPMFLYSLAQIRKNNFYNCRIDKIVNELSHKILSVFPTLHVNRIFLLWGMSVLNKGLNLKDWNNHILLLADTLSVDTLINQEFMDKDIFFKDGLVAAYLLVDNIKDILAEQKLYDFRERIVDKIVHSQVWEIIHDANSFVQHTGLFDGYCGVSLLMHFIDKRRTGYEN